MRITQFLLSMQNGCPFSRREKKGSTDSSRNRADSLHAPARQPSPFWGSFPTATTRRAGGRRGSYLSRGLPCTWRRRSRRTRRRARRCCRTRSRSRGTGCSCTPLCRCTGACPRPRGTARGAGPRWPPPRTRSEPPGSRAGTGTARSCRCRCRCIWRWRARPGPCSRSGSCRPQSPPACPESRPA